MMFIEEITHEYIPESNTYNTFSEQVSFIEILNEKSVNKDRLDEIMHHPQTYASEDLSRVGVSLIPGLNYGAFFGGKCG